LPFVLDASIAVSWHFEDEASPFAEGVLDRLNNDTALVPSLWPLEVANVLMLAERRGRLTPAKFRRAVELTLTLPIEVHDVPLSTALGQVADLAREHRLTAYDASYLALAMRERLPIATEDADLLAAVRRVGLSELA
jgi:predicted nucleic acid-binding protein